MNLPYPEYGKTDKETIDNLMDTVVKLRKELEYALKNIDVNDIIDFPSGYSDEEALTAWITSGYATFITDTGVYTGTVAANKIVVGGADGYIAFTGIDGVPEFVTGPGAVASWESTYIDAENVFTGNVYASNIQAGTITGSNIRTASSGKRVDIGYYTSNEISLFSSGGIEGAILGHSTNGIWLSSGSRITLTGSVYAGGDVRPTAGSSYDLGTPSYRWDYVYANSGSFLGNVSVGDQLYCVDAYSRVISTRALYINSGGEFGTTSSSRRRKENIIHHDFDLDALMQLDVVQFNFKEEFTQDRSIQHGVIAEDAHDLGLLEFVQYDDTGLPDYFAYEKLPAALLQTCQWLNERIKRLEVQLG